MPIRKECSERLEAEAKKPFTADFIALVANTPGTFTNLATCKETGPGGNSCSVCATGRLYSPSAEERARGKELSINVSFEGDCIQAPTT